MFLNLTGEPQVTRKKETNEVKRCNMKEKKEKKAVIDEFVTNQNGVRIKKCCASCATHKPYDSQGPRRLCTYDQQNKVVRKDDLCSLWSLSEAMNVIRLNGCRP